MKKQILLSFFFCIIWLTAVSQEHPSVYIDASIDSVYHHKMLSYLTERVIPKCNLGSLPTWTKGYGPPRTLMFLFKIHVSSTGEIIGVKTEKAEFSFQNSQGKIVKEPPGGGGLFFSRLESCYRDEILKLKKLEALKLNGVSVDTEVPFIVQWKGI